MLRIAMPQAEPGRRHCPFIYSHRVVERCFRKEGNALSLNKNIITLIARMFLVSSGYTMVIPFLPLYLEEMGGAGKGNFPLDRSCFLQLLPRGCGHGAGVGEAGGCGGKEKDGHPGGGAARFFLSFLRSLPESVPAHGGPGVPGICQWLRGGCHGYYFRQCGLQKTGRHAGHGPDVPCGRRYLRPSHGGAHCPTWQV